MKHLYYRLVKICLALIMAVVMWMGIACQSPQPLRIGFEIISGSNQRGLVGRCADMPLIIRAYNLNKPSESIEGIPLLFEIVQGGGIFTEEPGYSTVTNADGKAGLHYHYGTSPGLNKVKVSILGDTSSAPVEIKLEGN